MRKGGRGRSGGSRRVCRRRMLEGIRVSIPRIGSRVGKGKKQSRLLTDRLRFSLRSTQSRRTYPKRSLTTVSLHLDLNDIFVELDFSFLTRPSFPCPFASSCLSLRLSPPYPCASPPASDDASSAPPPAKGKKAASTTSKAKAPPARPPLPSKTSSESSSGATKASSSNISAAPAKKAPTGKNAPPPGQRSVASFFTRK
jgi:hypothetical protein